MAETERLSDEDISVAEVRVVVKIAATESCRGNADLNFFCFGRRYLSRFLLLLSVRVRCCGFRASLPRGDLLLRVERRR